MSVARPGKWGNPFVVLPGGTVRAAVELFRKNAEREFHENKLYRDELEKLRGKNLACWCPLPKDGEPDMCHAGALLEMANR